MNDPNTPQGFILSDSALYSYQDQDVFPDIISFCSAIPVHLRPLFLIPISIQQASSTKMAAKVAIRIASDAMPSGSTEDADLFGTKTFVYDDNKSTIPSSEPGSIFDIDGADNVTHHQDLETEQDTNYQVPSDTSYMSDVDLTESNLSYPYRVEESQVRHSSVIIVSFSYRKALNAENIKERVPEQIKDNASTCSINLVSYDTRGKVYTFSVNCGNGSKTVRASLTDIDHLAMNCSCDFWRWNGPEFNAKSNSYMLGQPKGTSSPPNVRDPDRDYWLCKHAYAVLARMDEFVSDTVDNVTEDGQEPDDEKVLDAVEENWDDLKEVVEIPMDDIEEENDIDVEFMEDAESEDDIEGLDELDMEIIESDGHDSRLEPEDPEEFEPEEFEPEEFEPEDPEAEDPEPEEPEEFEPEELESEEPEEFEPEEPEPDDAEKKNK